MLEQLLANDIVRTQDNLSHMICKNVASRIPQVVLVIIIDNACPTLTLNFWCVNTIAPHNMLPSCISWIKKVCKSWHPQYFHKLAQCENLHFISGHWRFWMCAGQHIVAHGISKSCCLVVEFGSVPTMHVIWEESHGTPRLQFVDKTPPWILLAKTCMVWVEICPFLSWVCNQSIE